MRGIEELIEMRKRRKVPGIVVIDADSRRLPMADDWQAIHPGIAHLQPSHGENIGRADMRSVIGLTVYVSGTDRAKVVALRDAAIAAKAKRVISAVMEQIGEGEWITFRRAEIFDTDGHVHD